jgi:hypothetical protein
MLQTDPGQGTPEGKKQNVIIPNGGPTARAARRLFQAEKVSGTY